MKQTARITEKSDFTDILDALKPAGLGGVARRIRQLDNLIQNDPAEKSIDIKSLQFFTIFFTGKKEHSNACDKHKYRGVHTC